MPPIQIRAESVTSSDALPIARKLNQYGHSMQKGLQELVKAYQLAIDAKRDRWDFALELKVLRRCGLSESDFRWLVCKGIVEHRRETTRDTGDRRKFRPTSPLRFKKRSCFVLTDAHAQASICHDRGLISLTADQDEQTNTDVIPRWHSGLHELYLVDRVVKKFRWPAKNQETILAAFEEECWPLDGVDDPLPPHRDKDPKQRLRDTIKCLNRYQTNRFVRFRGDGSGQRVVWEYTSNAIESLGIDYSALRPARNRRFAS